MQGGGGGTFISCGALEEVLGDEILTMAMKRVWEGKIDKGGKW
jgi:hypothetical protein